MTRKTWPTEDEAREALAHGDGDGVKIAIIDSGVCTSHPALEGLHLADDLVVSARRDVLTIEQGSGDDVFGHGTAIAYLVRQAAPKAVLGSIRVMNAMLGSRNEIIRAGVRAAMDRGYHVLNCSFGCRDQTGQHIMKYKDWVDEAYLKRIHIVTACNNTNYAIPEWPGFFPTCVNVNMARTDAGDFYYRPDHLVEFAAAGVNLRVPWLDGHYKEVVGSSYSAPRVAGYLARLLGRFPDLSVPQAKSLLHHLGTPWSPELASGNITT